MLSRLCACQELEEPLHPRPLTVEVLKKFFILEMWNSAKDRLSILHPGCFEESKVDYGAGRNPDQLPTSSSLDSSSSYFPVSLSSIYQQRESDNNQSWSREWYRRGAEIASVVAEG